MTGRGKVLDDVLARMVVRMVVSMYMYTVMMMMMLSGGHNMRVTGLQEHECMHRNACDLACSSRTCTHTHVPMRMLITTR